MCAQGIATSLKVLFSADDCSGHPANAQLALERNEVIALLNLLERLSNSIEARRSPRTCFKRGCHDELFCDACRADVSPSCWCLEQRVMRVMYWPLSICMWCFC